ncbi:uncharacterized protein LOC118181903 [Stegodyphus dumicola]|uniref:uncharacterized protein LOC118181903 n=1 Tax=Stegodyphus dumicola TaxID=202533 RepID=UPI0015AAD56A|nr:uncharacterized protein LOC118181903 [Stegodyphus dumicola]
MASVVFQLIRDLENVLAKAGASVLRHRQHCHVEYKGHSCNLRDIEKAFLQIVLAEKDRDAVRFLFVKNIDTPLQNTDDQLEVYRFKRVLFGVNSSPFLLAATIKLHIQKYRNVYPDTFQILDTCMYVDDLVTGADDVSEALKTSREVKEIMRGAGMNLRKWVTNDYHLAKKWEEENFDIHPLSSNERILKILRIQSNIQEDSLSIETSCLTEISRRKKSTKRLILQTAGKIYDPLGLITPFTVRIKLLLQKLWLRKLPWDEELPSDLNDEWSHQKLYGAAVYVKVQNEEKISVNLLASKSRVSPVKKVSLPRLELLGALIAARLGTEVKKVLDRKDSSNIFFWSDSKVTLYWIKGSSRRWKSFVQNRVDEIQKLTNPDSWFYCSTKDNPADLLTRGVSSSSLVNNSKWWTCAEFFTEPHLPYKCLQPIVPEVENLTPNERESFVQESKSSSDINDISERTMLIDMNSNVLDELLNINLFVIAGMVNQER